MVIKKGLNHSKTKLILYVKLKTMVAHNLDPPIGRRNVKTGIQCAKVGRRKVGRRTANKPESVLWNLLGVHGYTKNTSINICRTGAKQKRVEMAECIARERASQLMQGYTT